MACVAQALRVDTPGRATPRKKSSCPRHQDVMPGPASHHISCPNLAAILTFSPLYTVAVTRPPRLAAPKPHDPLDRNHLDTFRTGPFSALCLLLLDAPQDQEQGLQSSTVPLHSHTIAQWKIHTRQALRTLGTAKMSLYSMRLVRGLNSVRWVGTRP